MNILYFVCHDLGRELGCYGAGVATPNLDRFAAEGVRFNRAFCSSPACSPSRACAMTGQYAHTNGLMGLVNGGWSLPLEARTIVDYLNDAGYETAHCGLQHERVPKEANRYQFEMGGGVFVEDAIASAVRYLEGRAGSGRPAGGVRPFYLNVGTIEVHTSVWSSKTESGRLEVYRPGPPEQARVPPFLPDVPVIRREIANFQACIRYLDGQIQTLFDVAERLGLRDDTLVVFATDHGISGERCKGTLYDHGVEIALLMQGPGIGRGEQFDHLIGNIDLCPTLLEAAGVEIPPQVQGRSFWPLLAGGDYRPHEAIFTERNHHGFNPPREAWKGDQIPAGYDPMRAVRTDRYHYIRNLGESPRKAWLPHEVPHFNDTFDRWYNELWAEPTLPRDREELFDVASDPHEARNLASDPEYQSVKQGLADRLDRWMAETGDPVLSGPAPIVRMPSPAAAPVARSMEAA